MLVGALLCSLGAARAQTSTNSLASPTPATFFDSVGDYFTSFNTNSTTFSAENAEVWASADYQSGLNFAAGFGVQYELPANVTLESYTRNAGVAGTIVSENIGAGYVLFKKYDTKIVAGVDGGWRWDLERPDLEVYLDARKALTANTFAGVRISYENDFSAQSPGAPIIGIITGFKF